jgi:GNAT superfamily N-acetyltransferase
LKRNLVEILPLRAQDLEKWAELLAVSFHRSPAEMACLLQWLLDGRELAAWGAWDGARLAAQYSALVSSLHIPGLAQPVRAGLSLNMAVHPDYRGRGLIKQVSQPVYQHLAALGGAAGVGFSNAEGVQVDKHSKSYGYRVCGQMQPLLAWLPRRRLPPLELTDLWPLTDDDPLPAEFARTHFVYTPAMLRHRFAAHPFRRFRFGVWREGGALRGLVIYRPVTMGGLPAAALLAAYSDDLSELLARWGAGLVHVVASPGSALAAALRGRCLRLPYTRSPYYLTLKPLRDDLPAAFFAFEQWDCTGGDIL